MALIYCRECGKKYSSQATKCPRCGYVQYNLSKSIGLYLVLCLFVGAFGVHRFYAGKTNSGIVMFVLSLTGVGMIVTGVWSIVDLINGVCNISTPKEIFGK